MTTIAANLKEMACDSRTTDGSVFITTDGKVVEIAGDLIGSSGNIDSIAKFLEWYEKRGERPDFEGDDFESIALTKDGLFLYANTTRPRKIVDAFAATGSGSQAALAAMHLGACPRRAVEVAALVDNCTGGPVIVKRVKRK